MILGFLNCNAAHRAPLERVRLAHAPSAPIGTSYGLKGFCSQFENPQISRTSSWLQRVVLPAGRKLLICATLKVSSTAWDSGRISKDRRQHYLCLLKLQRFGFGSLGKDLT